MYVASLVLGILSVIFCWIPLFGVIPLIISIIACCGKKKYGESGYGMAIAGLILSIISVAFMLVAAIFLSLTAH